MQLSHVAQRVLGSLVEKALATPQAYPLSVNALRAACNQTTGRDPVTDLDEATVVAGLAELRDQGLVAAAYARRSSTPKYAHRLDEHLELDTAGVALLGVLLLRGAQTVGELRQRTDRMHHFAELAEVQQALEDLAGHHFGALVEPLPRQPGQKEVRWRHLLGDPAVAATPAARPVDAPVPVTGPGTDDLAGRVEALEEAVAELRRQVATLRHAVEGSAGDRA